MEKSKTHYWAIFQDKEPVFEGSFNDCWKQFVEQFGNKTVSSLTEQGIRIARKA